MCQFRAIIRIELRKNETFLEIFFPIYLCTMQCKNVLTKHYIKI